jgi:hypothetical protein
MLFDPRIHPVQHLAKDILGRLEKLRGGLKYQANELLVLNYHSTPIKFIAHFEKQVDFLSQHYNVIGPANLEDYFAGTLRSDRCSVLFTFDDGLKNNLHVARILEKKNMRALFFIVPAFIETPLEEQKNFYLKNIRPTVNDRIDHNEEDFSALSWEDLKTLIERGHAVGAHTLTHTLVANGSSLDNSQKEIIACRSEVENKLSVLVDSFCSINDTLLSVGSKEKKMIEENYRYHFTTLPGYNSIETDRLFIKRRNVECFWPTGAFYYSLGKSDLKRWEDRISQYADL